LSSYDPAVIEEKWQKKWAAEDSFKSEIDYQKTKYYVLEMFPYPSGKLHMGHMRVYSIGDVLARFLRMRGFNVIHPMGWDAFGLPAENAAIDNRVNPAEWTARNISHMKNQQNRLGVSYDWSREVNTSAPDYYRWSQWLFLLMFDRGLAYKKKASVNWCETCETVLANEQVEKGLCWRCSSPIETRDLEQWFLRITDYGERLLHDLDQLEDWPERVKIMQKNWIGRSEGAEITFQVKELPGEEIHTFTTRPDTLFGVTSMVLAPEHPMVKKLVEGTEREKDILDFAAKVRKESEIERTSEDAPKIGLFTGRHVINPVNGEEVPVLVGNYVLIGYGTGAVMGVPAHDQRDFVFARKHNLPVRVVIQPEGEQLDGDTMTEAYPGQGKMVNSGQFTGMDNEEGMKAVTDFLEKKGFGNFKVTYRLRDWLISRQRYWGAPIPIINCEKCGTVPVPREDLPVMLPDKVELSGNRVPPLSHYEDFISTTCPLCGGSARRETDTMDTFICSSWYFLRYTSPGADQVPFQAGDVDYWMPVDQYIGGIEHAVLHLLYARFFTKVLFDAGMVKSEEPFSRLLAQGMVYKDGSKMSKSKGNVVTPDEIVKKYGADTGRIFILFAAPPEKDLDWNDQGVEGAHRFLRRIWKIVEECKDQFAAGRGASGIGEAENELERALHGTIKKVTYDIQERFNFNTAISSIMELVNALYAYRLNVKSSKQNHDLLRDTLDKTILLLAPFAPHLAEEAWMIQGHSDSVHNQVWPEYNPDKLIVEEVEVVVQINGKVRGRVVVPADCTENDLVSAARSAERVGELLKDKQVVKVITVPGRLVNIVVR